MATAKCSLPPFLSALESSNGPVRGGDALVQGGGRVRSLGAVRTCLVVVGECQSLNL
jgi:hypothetical protein